MALFLHLRFYRFHCPVCKRRYLMSVSPVLLGTGRRRCEKCQSVFNDGSHEWPELSGQQKFEYVAPTTVLGYFGGVVLTFVAIFILEPGTRERIFYTEMILLFMCLPWVPYFVGRARRVRESTDRLDRHKVFGDTDEFILST
jgi:hypothetical protein